MNSHITTEIKCLSFDGAQGPVPGHAITVHHYDWLSDGTDRISSVVYERWDDVAGMMLTVNVAVSQWTRYMKKSWPNGGSVVAVRMSSGRLIHATGLVVAHSDGEYEKAPVLCRDTFKVVTLGARHPLVEVTGVHDWARSKRRPEDEALVINPWARDNAAHQARMNAIAERVQP